MVRLLPLLALISALTCSARADVTPPQSRLALGLGPAFWLELGSSDCRTDLANQRGCSGALHEWYGGARTQVDIDVTRWLRVGAQFGFGGQLDAGSITDLEGDQTWTIQRWLLPMGIQAHAHMEPRRGLSLWAGPELLYALRLESVDGETPGQLQQKVYAPLDDQEGEAGDTGPQATFDFRSGLLVGANMGLDARLAERVWLGAEVALSFSLVEAGQLHVPQLGTLAMERSTTAMLRAGLILRVLL